MSFLIYSLPRSRSYWLSALFNLNGTSCNHDPSAHFTDINSLKEYFQKNNAIDTGLCMIHEKIATNCPELKIAILRRPLSEIFKSAENLGVNSNLIKNQFEHMEKILNTYKSSPCLHFSDMNNYKKVADFYHNLTNKYLDEGLFKYLVNENIQKDFWEEIKSYKSIPEIYK